MPQQYTVVSAPSAQAKSVPALTLIMSTCPPAKTTWLGVGSHVVAPRTLQSMSPTPG